MLKMQHTKSNIAAAWKKRAITHLKQDVLTYPEEAATINYNGFADLHLSLIHMENAIEQVAPKKPTLKFTRWTDIVKKMWRNHCRKCYKLEKRKILIEKNIRFKKRMQKIHHPPIVVQPEHKKLQNIIEEKKVTPPLTYAEPVMRHRELKLVEGRKISKKEKKMLDKLSKKQAKKQAAKDAKAAKRTASDMPSASSSVAGGEKKRGTHRLRGHPCPLCMARVTIEKTKKTAEAVREWAAAAERGRGSGTKKAARAAEAAKQTAFYAEHFVRNSQQAAVALNGVARATNGWGKQLRSRLCIPCARTCENEAKYVGLPRSSKMLLGTAMGWIMQANKSAVSALLICRGQHGLYKNIRIGPFKDPPLDPHAVAARALLMACIPLHNTARHACWTAEKETHEMKTNICPLIENLQTEKWRHENY